MCEKQIHPLNCALCSEEHIKTKCPLYLAGQQGILTPDECLLMNAMIAKIGCATCGGKGISYGVSVDDDNGYHVHFRLHAGLPGSRGLAGSLCLTKDEFEDFIIRIGAEVHR